MHACIINDDTFKELIACLVSEMQTMSFYGIAKSVIINDLKVITYATKSIFLDFLMHNR